MIQVRIRRAGPSDGAALSELGLETFRETFIQDHAIPYPEADLAEFLPSAYGLAATIGLIADPGHAVWIAEADGRAVGYAVAGPCALPYAEASPEHGELKRLYIRRTHRGGGLGGALMAIALDWLERDGPRPLWIGVLSGNLAAQRFYARYGFARFGEHVFPVGRWLDREFALRRGLVVR